MAPYRKDQLEKFAWSWAETCDPTQITIENVHAAYRILLPRCKIGQCRRNCKGNPHCLSCLGEERWLGCSDDSDCNGLDPEGERRTPGTDVGLKNLGATCYVNSLLQLWFHNFNFRKTIFLWNPMEDPVEKTNETLNADRYQALTVIGHLQSLFALMQYGNTKSIDPTDFIQCLRLDTNTQQDAQEFSKLFLSVLDDNLQHQSLKGVKDMIKDTFCGEYAYVTRCLKCYTESRCPSTFYELDLHIRGQKTLQDSLKEFMQIELLEGEDKYYCTVCKEKQNAQRFISLTVLPPVLNIQLMRFVFDKNLGYKKKLNSGLYFPEVLNMTEFLPSSEEEIIYNLSAVLVHSGRGANSGHYIAYILDRSTSSWYKYNDEIVEPSSKNLKWVNDDDYDVDSNGKRLKHPRIPKGFYHSFNAYMLVYTLSKSKNDVSVFCGSRVDHRTLMLHPYLENYVNQKNDEFEEYIRQAAHENEGMIYQSKRTQVEMASMITMLPVETDEEDFDAVASSFLEAWLKNDTYDKPVDNEEIVCTHGKLDPNNLVYTKYISSETADQLYDRFGGGPRLRSDQFVCLPCVTNKCFQIRVKNKTNEESKEICCRMRNRINENSVNYWVGRSSYRSWRRLVLSGINEIICNGGSVMTHLNFLDDTIQNYITINNNKYEGTGIPKLDPMKTRSCSDGSKLVCENSSSSDNNAMNNNNNNNEKTRCENMRKFKVSVPKCAPVDNLTNGGKENIAAVDDSNNGMLKEKLTQLYVYTEKPNCQLPRVREMLKEVIQDCIPTTSNYSSYVSSSNLIAATTTTNTITDNDIIESADNHSSNNNNNNNDNNNYKSNNNNISDNNNYNDDVMDVKQKFCSPPVCNGELINEDSNVHTDNHPTTTVSNVSVAQCKIEFDIDVKVNSENSLSVNNDNTNNKNNDNNNIDKDNGEISRQLLEQSYNGTSSPSPPSLLEQQTTDDDSCRLTNNCRQVAIDVRTAPDYADHHHHHDGEDYNGATTTVSQLSSSVVPAATSAIKTLLSMTENRRNEASSDNISCTTTGTTVRFVDGLETTPVKKKDGTSNNNNNNDDTVSKVSKTLRFDNEEEIICDEEEMKFNEDLLCQHGNLCIEENNRKLVPPEVWSVFKKYFPFAREFTSQDEPCNVCKSIASEDEVAKGMYKLEAQNQKESLLDLYLDRNRPSLLYLESVINPVLYYVVNKEFIYEWRKFIKEAGKKEPPYSIKNDSTLLCQQHSRLLYDANYDLNEFHDRVYLVRENEWQILSQIYKSDTTITVLYLPDRRIITDPDVCAPCMQIRKEDEDKAKYSYTNSKIYIKMLTNDEVEFSNDEVMPPLKRAKFQLGNDTNLAIDVSSAGCIFPAPTSRSAGMIVETRRSSRCRRKNGVKELTVSSDMSLLDIKKKICSILNVAPMDQHLSTAEGYSLTENASTLRELGILPGVVLNLKVDEPCETDTVEYLQSREPEAGFKGTSLVGC